jgi:hypothetical protein
MAYSHGFAGRKPVLAVISLALPPRGAKDDVPPAERREVMVKKLAHGRQGNPSAYRRHVGHQIFSGTPQMKVKIFPSWICFGKLRTFLRQKNGINGT